MRTSQQGLNSQPSYRVRLRRRNSMSLQSIDSTLVNRSIFILLSLSLSLSITLRALGFTSRWVHSLPIFPVRSKPCCRLTLNVVVSARRSLSPSLGFPTAVCAALWVWSSSSSLAITGSALNFRVEFFN